MSACDVVGVGAAVVDYIGVVESFPSQDSQSQLSEFSKQGGGNVSTALVALSRLGASTRYLGKLGDDELGRFVVETLRDEGVDIKDVVVEPGGSAGFAFIIVHRSSGDRTILWTAKGKPLFKRSELSAASIASARMLLLDEYEGDVSIAAGEAAREHGVRVVLDAESMLEGHERLLDLSDVIIASKYFAHEYTKCADPNRACELLYQRFPDKLVVVTAGALGCTVASEEGMFSSPAFDVEVVDSTGCGDVFHGAFAYGLLENWSLRHNARFACAAAALKCRALGGRQGIPSRTEVEAFLARRSAQ